MAKNPYIKRQLEDMNWIFIFEWWKQYFAIEHSDPTVYYIIKERTI